jgi:RNA polymerase sigma factor (sigma-70 family)
MSSLALSVTHLAPACPEHDLVAAVRRGDDRAFEELFSRYRRRIGSYVLGMVGDHGRAEDVTQEVFIAALRRIRDSERPIAFKPWIYEIARNACIDEFRRSRRTREVPLDGDDALENAAPGRLPSVPRPHEAVENRQQIDDLRGAFRGLSDSHHKVLVMRELEGRSYAQIGEELGMSRQMVESTLFRARRKLSEEYEELVSGRRCEHVRAVIDAGGERAVHTLGIRERRRMARHVSHCQPCRRYARLAGVDDSMLETPSIAAKLAALLPFPLLRWWRRGGENEPAAGSGSHQLTAVQSLQSAATAVDPSSPLFGGLGRAAAAAATLVIAGTGAGLVTSLPSRSHAHRAVAASNRGATGTSRHPTAPKVTIHAPQAQPASVQGGNTSAAAVVLANASPASTHRAGGARSNHRGAQVQRFRPAGAAPGSSSTTGGTGVGPICPVASN